MTANNVEVFPDWKKNATAAERFSELEHLAREQPERFQKVVVMFVEITENGNYRARSVSSGTTTIFETIGLMHVEINRLIQNSEVPG